MDADSVSFLEYGFKGAVGIIIATGGWLMAKLMAAVAKNKEELADHKLHTSENYAKKTELTPIYDTLKGIQNDVKILLGRKQRLDEDHN